MLTIEVVLYVVRVFSLVYSKYSSCPFRNSSNSNYMKQRLQGGTEKKMDVAAASMLHSDRTVHTVRTLF